MAVDENDGDEKKSFVMFPFKRLIMSKISASFERKKNFFLDFAFVIEIAETKVEKLLEIILIIKFNSLLHFNVMEICQRSPVTKIC